MDKYVFVDAGLKSIVGGELKAYTELQKKSREIATRRMIEEAEKLGCNAVIGVRFTTSSLAPGSTETLAFGTAVICEEK